MHPPPRRKKNFRQKSCPDPNLTKYEEPAKAVTLPRGRDGFAFSPALPMKHSQRYHNCFTIFCYTM